jgi:hypothetical protein
MGRMIDRAKLRNILGTGEFGARGLAEEGRGAWPLVKSTAVMRVSA